MLVRNGGFAALHHGLISIKLFTFDFAIVFIAHVVHLNGYRLIPLGNRLLASILLTRRSVPCQLPYFELMMPLRFWLCMVRHLLHEVLPLLHHVIVVLLQDFFGLSRDSADGQIF